MADITLDDLHRYAVARTLFKPTTLPAAIRKPGFVQAGALGACYGTLTAGFLSALRAKAAA